MSAACLPDSPPVALRPIIVLRPEPGAAATVARAEAAGLTARAVPLFAAGAVPWDVPDPDAFAGLLLTSANALRFGGEGLDRLSALPAWCVGPATAEAASRAGLKVAQVGDGDAQAMVDRAAQAGLRRLLWLAGEARTPITVPSGVSIDTRTVYHAAPLPVDPVHLRGPAIMLLHSQRAARRLAALIDARADIGLIAISAKVAAAAGTGWDTVHVAARPDDGEMVAMAAKLCHEAR